MNKSCCWNVVPHPLWEFFNLPPPKPWRIPNTFLKLFITIPVHPHFSIPLPQLPKPYFFFIVLAVDISVRLVLYVVLYSTNMCTWYCLKKKKKLSNGCILLLELIPGAGGEGDDRGWDGWMASLTRWTWVWVDSGNWWWTGRPGVLRFMGSQGVGHDWATELNWTEAILQSCKEFSQITDSSVYYWIRNY